jgi:hypothetical protein
MESSQVRRDMRRRRSKRRRMGRDYADTHAKRKSTGSKPADALTARQSAPLTFGWRGAVARGPLAALASPRGYWRRSAMLQNSTRTTC